MVALSLPLNWSRAVKLIAFSSMATGKKKVMVME